ncbi:Rne/Rng family ribonuclease [Isoptericola sp. 4D.3]|uniref:Rne/Rng family ribonuclease n=1 Tax=Isoptericola peretonis TaxID=2918523 RepID=A0ABT0J0N5_9MICO|nr:Rne/Rng family ribonuclease [Isoptericola sp. 4D.3]
MTSDTPTGNPTDAAAREQSPETPARKPARRRATRPAAAPTAPAPGQEGVATSGPSAAEPSAPPKAEPATGAAGSPTAGLVLPDRTESGGASPAAGTGSLADIVLPEGPGGRVEDDVAQKPARSRRRATRTVGAQGQPEADGEASAPTAAQPDAEPAAGSATEPAAEPAAKGRGRAASATTRTRARRAAAKDAPADEPAAPAQPAVEETGAAEQDAAAASAQSDAADTTATKKAPARKRAGSASKAATKAPASKDSASKGSAAEAPAAKAGADEERAADDAAAAPAAETQPPRSPAARGGGSGTPRLATTALLFQAPDLSTARRSRRAQAPAGPPRPHDAEMPSFAVPEPTAAATAGSTSTRPASAGGAATDKGADKGTDKDATAPRSRSRRSTRASRAEQAPAAEDVAATDATAAEASQDAADAAAGKPAAEAPAVAETAGAEAAETAEAVAVDLTEDEAAAVEEVGVIESELEAEGVELVDLGPEDLSDEDGDEDEIRPRRRRRRGGRGRRGGRRPEGDDEDESDDDSHDDERPADGELGEAADETGEDHADEQDETEDEGGDSASSRRRRRRRRGTRAERAEAAVARTRDRDEVTALKGSTRLEAKRQRRREGRDAGRRRQIITEAEFLARRESVTRSMVVRERDGRTQIAVLEDGVLVEHYVSQQSQASMVGNVYLGRVQNVLPSMEAAFVDVGKGRNAVLYAGEVNWDAAGLEGQPRRIEEALKSGDSVLVQVTKDPIGHKGARLTSQVTLAGRYLVFVPGGGMTGISRKLPDTERSRLKKILRDVVPEGAGVIVRTAAEGASEAELRADVERLQAQWASIEKKAASASAPALLQGEPDLAIRVVRDIFNDDFSSLQIQGDGAWDEIAQYVEELAPDLRDRVTKWVENTDVFAVHRVDEQLAKGMDRKVWLPSGGSLVIDRTEAMTVVDVNTGKFTGAGGTLEETVTRNNLEAAEEIVRQLRLRDIGGIVVIDFIDMVLESNRDLVLRRLVECLGRDRTKHQVAEVTSLGLVQMTRKRVGQGLVEAFSETCEHCKGRGFIVHSEPIERGGAAHQHGDADQGDGSKRSRRKRGGKQAEPNAPVAEVPTLPEDRSEAREAVKATLATIAAAAAHAHDHEHEHDAKGDAKDGAQDSAPTTSADAGATVKLDLPAPAEPAAAPVTPVAPETIIELPERSPEAGAEPEAGEPAENAGEKVAEKPVRKGPRRARKGAGAPSAPGQGAGEAAAPGLTGTE